MTQSVLVRVQSIRSQNPYGRGGCIFTGTPINKVGDVTDAKTTYVIKARGTLLGEAHVQPGQWWTVTGEISAYSRTINGYVVSERQICADEIALVRLSGEHIVSFIAESDNFQGIGIVKARKLWAEFGERLYEILDAGDVASLESILTPAAAECAVKAWASHESAQALQWLQSSGIDVRTGKKLMTFFGKETHQKLKEDPYRLLSFSASWKHVDSFARSRFDVKVDDPRRLQAAVEEALYRLFDEGDTVFPILDLLKRVESVLGGPRHRSLVMSALESGLNNGSYVIGDDGNVHLLGTLIMEKTVANSIAARLIPCDPLLTRSETAQVIAEYEQAERLDLNVEQKQAVHCAIANPMTVILGGAGVGKTTVLKALYKAFDAASVAIHQMALSGRAAKRMSEATGRASSTLARFFCSKESANMAGPTVVVVDEASMVDIITMHRLCEILPAHVRLILVGDTSQLMPVGPGLVLHALAGIPGLPIVELIQVKRYGGAIAKAAAEIRSGYWPRLPSDAEAPISFLACEISSIPEMVVSLYASDRDNTQILSTRRNNADGVKSLNELCQGRFSKQGPALLVWNDEFDMDMSTGLHLGDLVLCTKNLWDFGLQNGSLGKLVEIERTPRLISKPDGTELGHALAWIDWDDGELRPVLAEMLEVLELGYALTVHKAQGSQWKRVIVVLTGSRMLDRTLVYTAITRAQSRVVIVGDEQAVRAAVEAPPHAELRNVGLQSFVVHALNASLGSSLTPALL